MIKLIINADDFGFDIARNDAILECFEKKEISTTTIMANMPGFEDGVARAHKLGLQDCIGLHLNFTQGMPLTKEIKAFPNFCNPDGSFNAHFHRSKLGRFFLSRKTKKAIYNEAKAQMLRYKDAGFTMMHLDSHHHSHTDPVICKIVCPLAKKLGFKSIRLSRNFNVVGSVKKMYKWYVNRIIKRNSNYTSDVFTAFFEVNKYWESLVKSDSTIEMMVHPNYGSSNNQKRELYDYNNFWSPISSFLKEHRDEMKMITFLDLTES